MNLSQEQPPEDIPESLRSYLERLVVNIGIALDRPPKFPERREDPYKPQVGDVQYFGNPATHAYDAAITTEGFWGYTSTGWILQSNLTGAGTGDLISTNNLSDVANAATARTNLDVDQAGTDNSTDVTLAGTGTYLSLAGQAITVDPITESDVSDLQTYLVDKADVEAVLIGELTSHTHAAAAGAGQWVLLEDYTPTAVNSYDHTWDETLYSAIRIELDGVQPSADTNLQVQVGHTDGATILNNTSDYKSTYREVGTDTAWIVSSTTDAMQLDPAGQTVDASGTAGLSGTVEIIGGTGANLGVFLEGKVHYKYNVGDLHAYHTQGFMAVLGSVAAFDTVRLSWDGGSATFALHGSIRYYGLKNT